MKDERSNTKPELVHLRIFAYSEGGADSTVSAIWLAMNAYPILSYRRAVLWPAVGLLVGAFVSTNPFHARHITLFTGIAAWSASMLIVLLLSAHPVGARIGALIAGVFAAVPCFVEGSPWERCLLMCFMGIPFIFASATALTPPINGFRSRLQYLCSWFGAHPIERQPRRIHTESFQALVIAISALAAAIVTTTSTPDHGFWILLRWLGGGVALLAVAEIATAIQPLMAAAFGVDMPPFFQSPFRSKSVNEFWTKRWNIPASAMFRRYAFGPLARRSTALGLLVTFVVSASAHALLAYVALGRWGISLICGSFFIVQPILIATERRLAVRQWPNIVRRAWTLVAFAITAPLIIEPVLQIFQLGPNSSVDVLVSITAVVGFLILFCGVVAVASLASLPAEAMGQNR